MCDGCKSTNVGGQVVNVQMRVLPRAEDVVHGVGNWDADDDSGRKPAAVWNSLKSALNIGTFSGTESYTHLKYIFFHFVEDMILLADEGLTWTLPNGQQVKIPIRFWGGGDLALWSKACGMGGCFSAVACNLPQCDCHSTEYHCIKKKCNLRTLQEMFNLAHRDNTFAKDFRPWKCNACGKKFYSQADVDADEPPSESQRSEWRNKHFGVHYGEGPLLPIKLERIVPCTLHLLLTIVKRLWRSLIAERVLPFNRWVHSL